MDIVSKINSNLNTNIKPKRIVSLVPSVTELLFHLGLGDSIVGVTNYCKYPENKIDCIAKLGGTKSINFETISNLNPDLIISVKEENNKNEIVSLSENYNIFVGDLHNYNSALQLIIEIGEVCKVKQQAKKLVLDINNKFAEINTHKPKSCCYLIWNEPIITVGNNTYINSMLNMAGFNNVFSHINSYPSITQKDITNAQPEYIMLSSEPFKFTEKHKEVYQKLYPNSKVILVDGEMFSWYGSRMLLAPNYFETI